MSSYYDRIDVLKNRARCVDVRSVVKLFDFGPQPPSVVGVPAQADARRLRKYEIERVAWESETGNKPVAVAFNSCDASEIRVRDGRRWRASATAPAEEIEPRSTGSVVVNLVAQSGVALGGYWLLDITTGTKWVVFSCDRAEWLSRGRGQFQETTPS
jgi:hypothetical protein